MSTRGTKREASRLSNKETDWMLDGGTAGKATRTRGGGKRRPPQSSSSSSSSSSSEDDDEWEYEGDNEDEEHNDEDEAQLLKEKEKPEHERVIVELKHVQDALEQFSKCPECKEPLRANVDTICITTSISLSCSNEACEFIAYSPGRCAKTVVHKDDKNYERMTDYALNVLYVVGFISMGDAHTEAGRLLGLLGLPNDTTMKSRSFTMIEERIGPFIRELCDDIITENLIDEVRLSMEASNTLDYFETWKSALSDASVVLDPEKLPEVNASYDMGWQQKGSGRQYNSVSGHGSMFGMRTRRLIGLCIKSKVCCYCNAFKKRTPDAPVDLHHCFKNHVGSSGSMESQACVEILTEAFDKRHVIIRKVCCDDDTSIRADCSWSNADYLINNNTNILPQVPKSKGPDKGGLQPRPDKGSLPARVPEPVFVADPNHRRKCLTGDLHAISRLNVGPRMTMTRMDATRLGKNFSYMSSGLKNKPEAEWPTLANAVLEHHFDNHDYCGDWCRRKLETPAERLRIIKYYRCKEKDAKLYTLLLSKLARFITVEKLRDIAHGLDTNVNESFNNLCTWFAPKNKVFAGSGSLHNRITFAVGMSSLGHQEFFTRLFTKLGIKMTDNVNHYLNIREKVRTTRQTKVKTREGKLYKNQKKHARLLRDTREAKMAHHKRAGTYRTGMNLDNPYDEPDDNDGGGKPPARKRRSAASTLYCEYCGLKGHSTTKSKKCLEYGNKDSEKKYRRDDGSSLTLAQQIPLPPASAAAMAVADNNADDDGDNNDFPLFLLPEDQPNHLVDCSQLDAVPLGDCSDASGFELFHDAGTWDSDGTLDEDRVI
jgi:hypothetical protein